MATHISHAALPYPVKNARYTLLVPYLDADGDPTDPTTPDTEVSQDGGAFADATEEVTTITGSNGAGFVTLTASEMNNSAVFVAFKVASGPKATLMTVYPRVLPILENGTAQAGAAGSITLASGAAGYDLSGCIVRTTGGTGGGGANNQARVITAYNTSTKVATVVPNWETNPDATTTYDILVTESMVACAKGNITHINGGATDGNNATLSLKQLNITNSAGNALHVESTGGNGHGLYAKGAGTGSGLSANGGSTSSGAIMQGGSTSGAGLQLSGVGSSAGLDVAGGATGRGISAIGNDSQAGIYASNNATGQGVDILGGSTSGEGLRIRSNSGNAIAATSLAGNGHGMVVTGQGTGAGLRAVAGATGVGAIFVGGSTSGEGWTVSATSGNAVSFTTSGGNGHGFVTTGQGSGEGFRAVGGATGNGFEGVAGSTSGDGIKGTVTAGIPINTGLLSGTVAAGSTSTTLKLGAGPATNDIFNGTLAILATGAGAGQCRLISDYEGATATCTVTPAWTVTPSAGDVFEIVHWGTTQAEPMTTFVQHSDTAQAGAATTITLAATASATDDLYNGQFIKIYEGTGAGQSRAIIDYNGTTKVATVDRAWVTNPSSTSKYSIMASNVPALDATVHGVLLSANAVTATAIAADAITAAKIADNAIDAGAIAADAITAAKIADGAIDANTFAAGAITAAAVATGAIDADALSADAGTEISDAVWAKAMTELAAVPGVTGTVLQALEWLFLLARNKRTTTSSTETLKKDDTTTNLATATVSDDGTTFTREEWA